MNTHRVPLCRALAISVMLPCSLTASARASDELDYNRDIRPILVDRCFVCHGPDSGTRKANLRLDIREQALAERRGDKHAIVPGQPDQSEAIRRILAEDALDRMPPPESNLSLSSDEKSRLTQWVAQGAVYQPHWSLIPLPGQIPVPAVKDESWPRSGLDRFVLARLEAEGLAPAPQASRERWLRRVTFDLTGLPPSQAEIDAFLADGAPDAHERVVERLLSSPRFGEKLAVQWLDAARYADSYGYQADLDTHAWPYRDWVIQAFNENLPYDQFIIQQLAGDLLPGATRSQKLATAFLRVHRKTQEGGSVVEEFRQDGISDRVHTVGTALMGLTLECARCHDHKYDPITMRDYYGLGAFFNSIDEWGLLHGNSAIQPHPVLYLTTPEQDARLAEQRAAIARAEAALKAVQADCEPAFEAWLGKMTPPQGGAGAIPLPVDLEGAYDLEHLLEGKLRNAGRPAQPGTLGAANTFVLARAGHGVRFTGDDAMSLTHGNCRHMHDPISVAFWLKPAEDYPRAVVFHNSKGADPGFNGYELLLEQGRLRWMFAREWPGNCIAVRTRNTLPVNEWSHVAVTYDGSARAGGLRIYINGQAAALEVVRDKLAKDSGDNGRIDFGERFRDAGLRGGVVDEVWIFSRAIAPIEVAQLHDGRSLAYLLAKASRSEDEIGALRAYYLSAIDPQARAAAAELRKARVAFRETMDQVPEIPVMEEQPEPRPTFILTRGAYDAPGEPVARQTPAALPLFPADAPPNRLGLARWLTQPEHPLTARVAANRLWQEFFGRGLVTTTENFGLQGQLPSHPELLDWLARDFIAHGWDVKRFCRQIVLSATYRQDSRVLRELRERDPDNILLARGPARRLTAEMLRDNALAVSGLLTPDIGGPPAKPYQPDGSMWRALNNFLPEYKRDTGPGLYRRSMYTFWRRTTPPPNMLIFDSGTREICAVRRQLTLTPLQPLALLNDPQFVEAARALGQRILQHGGSTTRGRMTWAFREVAARRPTPQELTILCELYEEQLACYRKDASLAPRLLQVGDFKNDPALPPDELAAATMAARALFNLDAAVMLR